MSATKRWTAEEVRALMDENRPTPRYELIDGELLVTFDGQDSEVTNAPAIVHQRVVRELVRALDDHARAAGLGEALTSPADLELEPDTIVQPDVFVLPASAANMGETWRDVRSILLAVEVLSPSTSRYDRVAKRRFYQRVGVPEYWVVDADSRVIERWRPEDERPELLDLAISWHPEGSPAPLTLDLPELFARVHRER